MSYDFWFMKKKLDEGYYCNTSSNEFLTWIQYKRYPVISWKQNIMGSRILNTLSQNYNTSYRWLIPLNLKKISLKKNYKTCLSSYVNSARFVSSTSDYVMVDIQQAGKYI